MKSVKSAVLLTALALLLSACGVQAPAPAHSAAPTPSAAPAPAEPMSFTLPCYSQDSFHPLDGDNRTNLALGGLLYEGLYELDASFEPQSVLAVAHTVSEDGLSWTFTLRQGVTFSDGSPLTGAAVAGSLNQARKSALYSARLAGVRAVTAGEGAVTVTLSAPNGALDALLDVPIITGGGDRPLGTGPYVLGGGAEAPVLTAREGWWRGKPLPLDTIALTAIQEPDDLIYAFDTREVSLVSTDLTGSNALGYSGSYETLDYPTTVLLYLGFNTRSGPCRDAGVRRALLRGVDRNTVSTALLSRHAAASPLPFPPGCALWDAGAADALAYSPQAMLDLLGEAGWTPSGDALVKGRQPLSLTLLVNQDNAYKTGVADYLAKTFSQAGVQVTVDKRAWEGYLSALEQGEFDLYLGETRLTADFDLSPLVGSGGALNYGGYSDAGTSALLAALRSAQGEARPAAAGALAENLALQAPIAPLCFKTWSVLTQWGQVTGLSSTQQNVFHHFWAWELE